MKRVFIVYIGLIGLCLQLLLMTAGLTGYNYRDELDNRKPNRYAIFLKTDTEYRTDFHKTARKARHRPTSTVYVEPVTLLPVFSCIGSGSICY